ncbi:helix-turn-helix transcriptional regulator [Deinococcus sp. QL22]|uniref:helix-turn-helix transcriptional regulator n=1 Tax=Deinococcus sp. QL22 TaxID=2939437 RepID=UPI0035301848
MGMQMKRLREHREARGLSREALAREAGVSAALIQAHEQGRNHDTHVSVASPLACALGIPMEELFAPEDMGLRVKS